MKRTIKEEQLKNRQCYDMYYVVAPGSDYGKILFSDIGKLSNAVILESPINLNNKLLKTLHHMHFSFAINNKIQLPFQNIWRFAYSLNGVSIEKKKKYCFIISDVAAGRMDVNYLRNLSSKNNVDMVLVLANVMQKKLRIMKKRIKYFDQIYTFDMSDAKEYGFVYYPDFYSKVDFNFSGKDTINDAFFIGSAGKRLQEIHSIYKKLTEEGCSADFYVTGVKKREQLKGIHYNKRLSYADVLKRSLQSNCIVEIVEEKQKGGTMRQREAIVYNRKLLTNNALIAASPLYDKRYISIIKEVDDIDTKFVAEQVKVDFHYNDEFSPIHLIDHINKAKFQKCDENT